MRRSLPPVQVQGARRRHDERFTLANIVPCLRNARQLPSGEWLASCPVPTHGQGRGDRNPSLSLTETPDGKLLVHCHAGCDGETVLRELRRIAGIDARRPARQASAQPQAQVQVSAQDDEDERGLTLQRYADAKLLNPDALRNWGVSETRYLGKPALRIEYRDEAGNLLTVQFRKRLQKGVNGEERFAWRKGDSPRIYGLWRLPEYSKRNLWVLEGSSDCHSLWSAGIPAVGMPNAYSKELAPDLWRIAERFERIYLCLDADSAGQGLMQAVVDACPPELQERACVVSLPDGHKDANDLWQAVGGDPDAFKNVLRECVANATPITDVASVSTVATVATVATEPSDDDALKVVSFDAMSETSAPAIVDGLVYAERLTLLVGKAGIGKTTLTAEVVNELLHGGRLWGRIQLQPARVLWVGYDHSPAHLKHLMNAYYGERPRPNLYFIESEWQEPLVPETFARWRALLEELRPDLLVCDTLHDFFATPDELSNLVARDSIQLLRRLVEGLGTGVILLHHPSKMLATTVSTRAVGGAHAWAAKVDVVALMHYASREGFPPDRFVKLSVVKNRESGAWQQVFERMGRRFIPVAEGELPHSEWGAVKSYLETHEQATYDDLLNALHQQGFRMTLSALKRRVQRWGEKGLLLLRREGFPAKTIIQLAQVQLNAPVSTDATDATDATVSTGYTDCVATDDADFHALCESLSSDDDFALDVDDLALLVQLWAHAKERGFPRIELPEYDLLIPQGRAAWLSGLRLMAGTPAVPLALQRLTLDARATAHAPCATPDAKGAGACPDAHSAGLLN